MNKEDPDHTIIDKPWEYQIIEYHFYRSPDEPNDSWIDLVLKNGSVVRRLRFLRPHDIAVHKGFPACPGLFIKDVSERGLDGLRVRVGDFEAGPGGIEFWAADVADMDTK